VSSARSGVYCGSYENVNISMSCSDTWL